MNDNQYDYLKNIKIDRQQDNNGAKNDFQVVLVFFFFYLSITSQNLRFENFPQCFQIFMMCIY